MLQTLETCFLALFAHHSDAFTLYDCDGNVTSQNDAALRLRSMSAWDEALQGPAARAAVVAAYQGAAGAFELTLNSSEGELHIRVDIAPIVLDGELVGISEIARDVRVAFADEHKQESCGRVPSLPIVYDRLARLLFSMRRDGRPFALHLVSIHPEVVISGERQHEFDEIVINRLVDTVRGSDTVARMGKNFLVVQSELLDHDNINAMTERLADVLTLPFAVHGTMIAGKAEIGTAIASRRTASVDDLLAEADLALARRRQPSSNGIRRIETA